MTTSSKDWMKEAFFAGVNLDANVYFCDIDDPEDDLHPAFERWYSEWWSEKFNVEMMKFEGE